MISKGFFNRGSKEFQTLKELIEIRDGFAHSRPVHRRMTLTKTGEKEFVADNQFKENFWPLTQFPKDIFIIDWNHANRAKEIVDWTVCIFRGIPSPDSEPFRHLIPSHSDTRFRGKATADSEGKRRS